MPELLMAAAEEGEVEGFAARVQLTRGFLVKNGTGINAGKSSVCKSDVCKSDICGDFDVLRTRSYWYR